MKLFKRIATGFLILSLSLSSVFTSLADGHAGNKPGDNLDDNANSGGQIDLKPPGAGADNSGVHKLMGYFENQGYRIYITDPTGERVTNSVDIVNYIPNVVETSNDQGLINGWYKYLDWFGCHKAPAGMNKANSFYFSNGIKTEDYTQFTWSKDGVAPFTNSKGHTIETNMYIKRDFEVWMNTLYKAEVEKRLVEGETGLEAGKIEITLPAYYGDGYGSLEPGGAKLIELLQSPIGKLGQKTNDKKEENILSFMINMKIPKANGKGDLDLSNVDYLFRFADPKLQERVGKEEVNKETGEKKITTVSGIVIENGYKVVIEPVYWHVCEIYTAAPDYIHEAHNDPNSTDICINWTLGVVYGTASYINKYAFDKANIPEQYLGVTWAGINWGECDLGATSLMLEHNDEQLGMVEPSVGGLQKVSVVGIEVFPIGQLASGDNYKSIGYSVHIYDKLLQSDTSGTPTWDKPTYPPNNYKPGPSPENSTDTNGTPKLPDYPPEGDEYKITNTDHKFHIVKFYAEKQPDGTYKYKENHTRDNTVHTININDEPNYKVDNYYTSTTYTKPTNPTDDYDVWKSSKATKTTYEGTKAERLTVKPSDPDTTLYIRLVSTPMLTVVK